MGYLETIEGEIKNLLTALKSLNSLLLSGEPYNLIYKKGMYFNQAYTVHFELHSPEFRLSRQKRASKLVKYVDGGGDVHEKTRKF
jgi:predicted LPLAT superfamily acyltransferase